ncbi:hypothetical protein J7K43_06585 [Candidatus Calescamantes bacterium]|nr:hypothetical protein [Candidatus Calescamantes bacterium]
MKDLLLLFILWGLVGILNLPYAFPSIFLKLRRFLKIEDREEERLKKVGLIIGVCESLIAVTLSFFRAWEALSFIFGGKILYRVLERENKQLLNYYLVGSLLNFTFWLMIGVIFSMFS